MKIKTVRWKGFEGKGFRFRWVWGGDPRGERYSGHLPVSGMETLVSRFERNPRMLVTTFWGDPVAPNSELPSLESRAFVCSPAGALPPSPDDATVTCFVASVGLCADHWPLLAGMQDLFCYLLLFCFTQAPPFEPFG